MLLTPRKLVLHGYAGVNIKAAFRMQVLKLVYFLFSIIAVCHWKSYLTPLSFSFLICKMKVIITYTL